jgi:hypothetical protein
MKHLFVYVIIIVIVLIGEVQCIYKAINCNWDPIGKAEIVYTVAACTGLGFFVGYMTIEDN